MGKHLKVGLMLIVAVGVVAFVSVKQGPYSFVFAWVLNFALMLAVSFYNSTFKPQLTSDYYNSKKWELNGTVYKKIGVNFFRKFLVLIGWEKVIRAANPLKKDREAIMRLEQSTRESEFGHTIVLIIVLMVNIYVALRYGIMKSLWLFFLNIILNLYPVLLQRFNRPRLQRALRINRVI